MEEILPTPEIWRLQIKLMTRQQILKCLLIAVIPAIYSGLFAQDRGDKNLGAWYVYFGTNTLSEKLSIHTELQFNFYEVISNFEQFWGITALNYHINHKVIAAAGYGYFAGDPTFIDTPGEENTTENRIFEQFILKNQLGKLSFQHRYRLEHRFIKTAAGDLTQNRFRYRLQLTHPLNEKWFINVFDEIFLNISEPVFNQNRLYAAVGYKITHTVKLQTGYMIIHFPEIHFDRLQLVLSINTDLRNKPKTSTNEE
jgi:hypothetical protein